jgi:gamma-glutamyl:cysteine ligase YbdK (ATP-grasp superfamily)
LRPLDLFEGYGIELEYMIVDRATSRVAPICDVLLQQASGSAVPTGDFLDGELAWSNELVQHVVELKTNGPARSLVGLAELFQDRVRRINRELAQHGARLMGSAMHPLMDPEREARIWPHEYTEVYHAYDRIFGCKGHGWSNLQSMHINLPFAEDEGFERLHAAIRVVLPLLPALAASSPFVEGRRVEELDHRMKAYAANSRLIPLMAGVVVPEVVHTTAAYHAEILEKLYDALAPHDPEGLLRHEFANARGAIARFDRLAIEIRVLDLQECPAADLAIAQATVALVRALCEARWVPVARLHELETHALAELLQRTIRDASRAEIYEPEVLAVLGRREPTTARELWSGLIEELLGDAADETLAPLRVIVREGTLAERMVARVGSTPTEAALVELCEELSDCLEAGRQLHAT